MQNPSDDLFLPDDLLLMEIFTRLPPKSVGKFRMLSKSWRTNLSSSIFIHCHLKHNSHHKDAIVVFPTGDVDMVTIPVDDDDGTITEELDLPGKVLYGGVLGSCNGLVTLVCEEDWILVLNPIILRQAIIPNTHPQVDNSWKMRYEYGFGYDSPSDDYKIVKLCIDETKSIGHTSVYVYSLRSAVWRRVDDSPYNHHDASYTGRFLNGAIHWLAFRCGKDPRQYVIAAFDVATEVFREIPLPNDMDHSILLNLYSIAGCLFIIDREFNNHDVCLMREYGVVDSWTNFTAVYTGDHHRMTLDPPVSIGENEFVYITDWGFIEMNLTEGTRNTIDNGGLDNYIGDEPTNSGDTCMFVGSLVLPWP